MKIIHIWWGKYPDEDEARDRRLAMAQGTWAAERARSTVGWTSEQPPKLPRDSQSVLGDSQPMPFFHDLIDAGLWDAKSDDIVLFTNADVGFADGISKRVVAAVREFGSAHMKRKEIGLNAITLPTPLEILNAPAYCGMDGMAFTTDWWRDNRGLMPDCVIGRYGWDAVARNIVRMTGGCEIPNAIWHVEHAAAWNSSPEVIHKNPANRHNRLLLWAWVLKHGGSDEDHLFTTEELQYRR